MFDKLAHLVVRRRRLLLFVALAAAAVFGALGSGVAGKLSTGGFDAPSAQATRAQRLLGERFGTGSPNVVLLVTARGGSIDDPAVAAVGRDAATRLGKVTVAGLRVSEVVSYWDLPPGNPLASAKGDRGLILARVPDDDAGLVKFSERLPAQLGVSDPASPASVAVAGQGPLFAEVNTTIERDLVRAELIAVPITLILLLFIFRGVIAAMLPLLVGVLTVVSTLFVLLVVNHLTTVSVYAINLTTMLGLGLAIDYSLFIVSRFREELAVHPVPVAVRRTVQTAGRTVAFSALTVAAALLALLVFELSFLRSFAYAGVAVAVLAGSYAVVVLPAILAMLGHRVDALRIGRRRRVRSTSTSSGGLWHRLAVFVMRRPLPVITAALAVLFVLGGPVLGLKLGLPDDRVLAHGSPTRAVHDVIRTEFVSEEAGAASVVVDHAGTATARAVAVDRYAAALAALPSVARVDAETGIYCGAAGRVGAMPCAPGELAVPAALSPGLTQRFRAEDATYLSVIPNVEPVSAAGERFVAAVRAVTPPFPAPAEVAVGGPSAQLVDGKGSLVDDLPLALAIIAVITFVLLFLMFGSVVVPLKALVLNVLSLSATFGAMVWVFQDGHLSGLLGFTATGSLTATIPVLMFCAAFGLSMDYEVFLLSRIKEEHDRGRDNVAAVATGLERTGSIVTAAALLMAVVFVAFATSRVSFIKLFGIGLTLAVLLDAFVIRGTLVPAFMRLAGDLNWWAPRWMRRIYERFGIHEHVELGDEESKPPNRQAATALAARAALASEEWARQREKLSV